MLEELMALLTPTAITNLAYLVGAFLFGSTILGGMFYIAAWFGIML
jgi:hypothetical protein